MSNPNCPQCGGTGTMGLMDQNSCSRCDLYEEARRKHRGEAPDADPAEPPPVTGDTSDGYHTFNELYDYRKAYNALLFNEWAARGLYDTHKSRRHGDGEPCFGGGWFVVVAQTPAGQITNHYKDADWALFRLPERERAAAWDGHTPQVALERMFTLLRVGEAGRTGPPPQEWQPIETAPRDGTTVMLFRDMPPWKVRGFGYWFQQGKIYGWVARGFDEPPGELGLAHPTHWMPLPAPPTEARVAAPSGAQEQ